MELKNLEKKRNVKNIKTILSKCVRFYYILEPASTSENNEQPEIKPITAIRLFKKSRYSLLQQHSITFTKWQVTLFIMFSFFWFELNVFILFSLSLTKLLPKFFCFYYLLIVLLKINTHYFIFIF